MILRNYHTHTTFCDGKDTAEEMVLSAIEKGFQTLGFSGHSPLEGEDWCMQPDTGAYRAEIARLKEKYKDKIEILCGIEQDYYSEPEQGYDYIIGSVHCVKAGEILIAVDDTAEALINGINEHFGGDATAFACEYFRTLSDVVNKTGAQIIGHFDLIEKFSEKVNIFAPEHPMYIEAAKDAIDKLIPTRALFEVNTGAMARGLRTCPYPAKQWLEYISQKGGDVILNSDCHDKRYLDHGFEECIQLLKACGFSRIAYLTKDGTDYTKI
ncbi:MAG: histidinol-phosphatase [Ruminococcus sp.]|nr:histidinol-phosphatase [Ruminococcus sp.]